MSYYAKISFKELEPSGIFDFLISIKQELAKPENLEIMAKENLFYSPIAHPSLEYDKFDRETKHAYFYNWVQDAFKYRWFYIQDFNILCMIGLPKCVEELFDLTAYFQNGTDQDYDFDTWDGLTLFEMIAENWKNTTDEQIEELYWKDYNSDMTLEESTKQMSCPIDYYRRSYCYDEIWKIIEKYFYDDKNGIYFSPFSPMWDIDVIEKFKGYIVKKYNEFLNDLENFI